MGGFRRRVQLSSDVNGIVAAAPPHFAVWAVCGGDEPERLLHAGGTYRRDGRCDFHVGELLDCCPDSRRVDVWYGKHKDDFGDCESSVRDLVRQGVRLPVRHSCVRADDFQSRWWFDDDGDYEQFPVVHNDDLGGF